MTQAMTWTPAHCQAHDCQAPAVSPFRRAARLLAAGLLAAVPLAGANAQVSVDWIQPTRGVAIAVDAANNVFTLDYEQALGAEMSVTKRDVNGNLLWTSSFDQTSPTQWERASWITADSAGDVIACGTLMSGYSNPVSFASIVTKFASNGQVLWRNVYQNGADGGTRKCLVDGNDNIYVLGLGSGPPGYVTRVDRFTPAGAHVWSYFDADGIGQPVNFKLTRDDQLVIAGRSLFGSINGYARIGLDGQKVWSLPGIQSLTTGDVAGDSLGNSYVVHGEYVTNGGTVIKKLDASGNLVFDKTYGLSAFRIEVGSDDRPVACGFPNPNQGGAAFIKIDQAGTVVWANLDADGPGYALLLHARLLLDDSDDAYLAAGTLFEMAVCKVNRDGSSAWTQTTTGSYATGIALGPHDDSIFVVGGATARLVDAAEGPWHDLGQGLAGATGIPLLVGDGDMLAGNPVSLSVSDASPAASMLLIVGTAPLHVPLFGGVLVPAPTILLPGLVTDGSGAWQLTAPMPAGVPAGLALYFQAWHFGPAGPATYSATNGLRATTP